MRSLWTAFFHLLLPFELICGAGRLPPPTELSYRWLDPFTVSVHWRRPGGLPDGCDVLYRYGPDSIQTEWTNFTETLLTDEAGSSGWRLAVRTAQSRNCGSDGRESAPAFVVISAPKPPAELVTDFKCFLRAEKLDCSWIPHDPSVHLTLSYRVCGKSAETRRSLKECKQPHRTGGRDGCYLSSTLVNQDVCMHLRSNVSMRTFQAHEVVDPPKLHVRVEGDLLNLSWTPPEVSKDCRWTYELCYSKCDQPEKCQIFIPQGKTMQIAYDKRCRYAFRSRTASGHYCRQVQSDFGALVAHGDNEARVSLTAVAIGVAAVVSAGVLLACYCLRRHGAVLFPDIPDPSAILKDMMMGEHVEIEDSTHFYIPVPESVQACKIVPAHELFNPHDALPS